MTPLQAVLDARVRPQDAAPQCMELMTGLFHPSDLTYLRCSQAALQSCILQVCHLNMDKKA